MKLRRSLAIGTATLATALAGVLMIGPEADAYNAEFRAKLRDPSGQVVGTVTFSIKRHYTEVDARLQPNVNVAPNQFHGFHVHANNDPANGGGCLADPTAAKTTWFVSADGHLSATMQDHGKHLGDLSSPLVLSDGTARLTFTTDRIEPSMLRDRAVILHDKPDNFGNVPIGPADNQYTAGKTALDATKKTGNAGDRVACGLVKRAR